MALLAASDDCLVRAAVHQALAVAFAYPNPDQQQRLRALLDGLRSCSPPAPPPLSRAMGGLAQASTATEPTAIEAEFNRLFSGKVACAPHETAYEPDIFRRQRALADIAGFHAAFALELPDSSRWQPDHIGVELETCSLLLQRQAHALEQGSPERTEVCEEALRAFLLDHLGRWCAAFARRLARSTTSEYYRQGARALDVWIRLELAREGLRPAPLADRPRTVEDDMPPACGGCPVAPSRR